MMCPQKRLKIRHWKHTCLSDVNIPISVSSVLCCLLKNNIEKTKILFRRMSSIQKSEFIVYHSLESVINYLKREEYAHLPAVKELLDIFHKEVQNDLKIVNNNKKYPFIVVEGLDASGKTTATTNLAKLLNAELRFTSPKCINHLRSCFENTVQLRSAFYCIGNYIEVHKISKILQHKPVVLDRFWHSTTAYALAQNIHNNTVVSLPEENDPIYEWPNDLLTPDIIMFLNVSEEERLRRIANRDQCTKQEGLLKTNDEFRKNVLEAYKRMRNPTIKYVNADLSKEKVLKELESKVIHLF